jgi:hypothetical protein
MVVATMVIDEWRAFAITVRNVFERTVDCYAQQQVAKTHAICMRTHASVFS